MLRLQGFPESYKRVGSYQTMGKLTGNAIAIPCVSTVIDSVINAWKMKIYVIYLSFYHRNE